MYNIKNIKGMIEVELKYDHNFEVKLIFKWFINYY